MKKLLLSLLILAPSASLFADLKQDPKTGKYYTVPASPYINQIEYDHLMSKIERMTKEYLKNPYSPATNLNDTSLKIFTYLATINTPTAERLMMDIFRITIFGLNK